MVCKRFAFFRWNFFTYSIDFSTKIYLGIHQSFSCSRYLFSRWKTITNLAKIIPPIGNFKIIMCYFSSIIWMSCCQLFFIPVLITYFWFSLGQSSTFAGILVYQQMCYFLYIFVSFLITSNLQIIMFSLKVMELFL